MMAALALATWSVQDPSLSHAIDAPVHNLLGMPGAIAADLMMQLLGLGSLALLLPIAVWGYRLLGHRQLSHERLRVLLWLVGAVLTAGFASCLPRSPRWPLPSGLGGVIGDAVLRLPVLVLHAPLAGIHRLAAAARARHRGALRLSPAPPAFSGATRSKRTTRTKTPSRPRTTTSAAGYRSACWRITS